MAILLSDALKIGHCWTSWWPTVPRVSCKSAYVSYFNSGHAGSFKFLSNGNYPHICIPENFQLIPDIILCLCMPLIRRWQTHWNICMEKHKFYFTPFLIRNTLLFYVPSKRFCCRYNFFVLHAFSFPSLLVILCMAIKKIFLLRVLLRICLLQKILAVSFFRLC
jgi:hypothetical protein